MGFKNPVLGGNVLIRSSIRSPNYVPGVSGWTINRDGTSEFTGGVTASSFTDITDGTLNATGTMGTGALQSASSGNRFRLDANGFNLYDNLGNNTVKLDASTGNAYFSGTVTASIISGSAISATSISGGSIFGTTITGSTLQTASSGARVVIGSGTGVGVADFYGSSGEHGYIKGSTSVFGSDTISMVSASGPYVMAGAVGAAVQYDASNFVYATANECKMQNFATGNLTLGSSVGGLNISISGTAATSATTITQTSVSNTNLFAGGSLNLDANNTVTLGASANSVGISPSIVSLANVPITAGTSVALKMVSRQIQGVSSARASKVEIRDADITPAEGLRLRPVQFYARDEVQAAGGHLEGLVRHFGFIAEEVDEIEAARPLVVRDQDGEILGLGYDRITAVQQVIIRDLAQQLADVQARLAALEAA